MEMLNRVRGGQARRKRCTLELVVRVYFGVGVACAMVYVFHGGMVSAEWFIHNREAWGWAAAYILAWPVMLLLMAMMWAGVWLLGVLLESMRG